MIYKLHYAKLGLTGDIPCIEFDELFQIYDFIDDIQNKDLNSISGFSKDKVFLITDGNEVVVTNCYGFLQDIITYELFALFEENDLNNIHLFEKETYEDAYKLALLIKTDFN